MAKALVTRDDKEKESERMSVREWVGGVTNQVRKTIFFLSRRQRSNNTIATSHSTMWPGEEERRSVGAYYVCSNAE